MKCLVNLCAGGASGGSCRFFPNPTVRVYTLETAVEKPRRMVNRDIFVDRRGPLARAFRTIFIHITERSFLHRVLTKNTLAPNRPLSMDSDFAIHAGALPPELGQLGALQKLDLSNNKLSGKSINVLI